jgi:iron complex transport system substrate-binding protein
VSESYLRAFIAILVTLFALPSLVSADSKDGYGYIELVDDAGRKVRIKKYPKRIVSLSPANTEILFSLGLGDKVIGVTSYCNFPAAAKRKEKIGGFANPDIEKIVALAPDLLFADSLCYTKGLVHKFDRNGLSTMILDPKNLTEVIHAIQLVGKATGVEKVSARLTADMSERIRAVTGTVSKIETAKRPRVLYMTWHDPVWVAGSNILANDLIKQAGGVNIAADGGGWRILSLEELLRRNPSVIVVCSGHSKTGGLLLQWTKHEPRLNKVDARKFGRIYEIDADLVDRFGPRVVEALEQFAHYLHPEVFGD